MKAKPAPKKTKVARVKSGTGDPFRPNADEWQKQWTGYRNNAIRSGTPPQAIPGSAPILRDGVGRSVGGYARGAFTRLGGGGSGLRDPKTK